MEKSQRIVLFIDDHINFYLSSLQPAAEAAGFELFAVDNVLDGIEFIKSYTDTVNAVILDYSFPKGEIQGLEALQRIKKAEPELPVIMLTDSDSAGDIDRVVECMRNGAYNYIGKRTLNPVYLFQVVESAVQLFKMQLRISSINNITKKKDKFFSAKTDCEFGRYTKSGIFGFELKSINKPGNERESASLEKMALLWHENFLKSISLIYCNEIKVNIKYIAENNKIKCLIIFTIYGLSDEKLEETIQNIQHDITPFFSTVNIDISLPYVFEEIKDYQYLLNANNHTPEYTYNVFFREPIKVKTKKSIGYNPASVSDESSEYNPDELFSFPAKFHYDNQIFNALINQKEYVEIDVELMPTKLSKEEIDLIRQVIRDYSLLDIETLNADELKLFVDYLQKFIIGIKDKFIISVMLKRKSENWLHNLKMGVTNYFFGLKEDVNFRLRKSENLLRYYTADNLKANQLPFFYSVNDATQVFRLPIPSLNELPGIKQQSDNFHFQPDNLTEDGLLMGIKNTVDGEKEIRIDKNALARHLYIMGQTGTGKSTMLKSMITDCLEKNLGFTVIDPHGDLFDQVLKLIPKNKKNKLFILDTSDAENSIKLNPLLYDENTPQAKSLIINEIIRAFSTLYDMRYVGGPMFETYFKNGLLLLMDEKVIEKYQNIMLSDMSKIFYNNDYRKELLSECGNKTVVNFFKAAEAMSGEGAFTNFAVYITSKLNRFVDDYYLAPLLTSKTNNIDFRKLIDGNKILLVKMDKGLIGTDNTSLLGQLLLSKLILAGMSRSTISVEERKPHYIFIDEFQNFVKGDIGTALSEVRKYGLNLILANQTLGQLDDYLIQSLLGNVGSLVFFRPGIYDYEKLKYYLEPDFKREDVLKLPNFNCISRLMIENVPSDPFVFQTKNI
jgi:CheY-like chemotaxis protein